MKLFNKILHKTYFGQLLGSVSFNTIAKVRFIHDMRCSATMADMRHDLATFHSNNFVVYGQKHKVWVHALFLS